MLVRALLLIAAFATPAAAEEADTTWVWQTDGAVTGLISDGSFDPAACMEKLKDAQVPNDAGWVASFVVVMNETRMQEFLWNTGNKLPLPVKACLNKALRAAPWPKPQQRGTMVYHNLVLLRPAGTEGDGWRRATLDPAAEAPFKADLNECFKGDGLGSSARGRVNVLLTVAPDGSVVSGAVTGGKVQGNRAPITAGNCILSSYLHVRYERTDEPGLRLSSRSVGYARSTEWIPNLGRSNRAEAKVR